MTAATSIYVFILCDLPNGCNYAGYLFFQQKEDLETEGCTSVLQLINLLDYAVVFIQQTPYPKIVNLCKYFV